jgi:NTE family protein
MSPSPSFSPSHNNNDKIENVLILQGGGSLGAFGCGVIKGLANNNIKMDIIAGTSIGGINAAIIAGSRDEKHPEHMLEQFWLEVSDSFIDIEKPPFGFHSQFVEQALSPYALNPHSSPPPPPPSGNKEDNLTAANKKYRQKIRNIQSFYSSAMFGNDKFFKPRWAYRNALSDPDYFDPTKWTYMYDHSPLVQTLEKYIDYGKLQPGGNPNTRLILTAVNILTAEPLTFDSSKQQITPKHILATSSYPLYNFRWIEVEEGVYAWDGSLLSNTPLREVLEASPIKNKRIFLVENYPKKVDALPQNIPEVYHRARDIIFSDKTEHNIKMSKVITKYLRYIDELYQIIEKFTDTSKLEKKQLRKIHSKYKKYKQEHGAEIKDIFYITRDENNPHIFENADFYPESIKGSIEEGETKTNQVMRKRKFSDNRASNNTKRRK